MLCIETTLSWKHAFATVNVHFARFFLHLTIYADKLVCRGLPHAIYLVEYHSPRQAPPLCGGHNGEVNSLAA